MAKKNKNETMDAVDYMEKIGNWIDKNSKIFILAFVALVIGIGAFWSYSLFNSQKTKSVAKLSGTITKKVDLLQTAIEKAKNPESPEYKEKLNSEIEDLNSKVNHLVAKYPSESLTDLTVIRMAGFLESQDQKSKALELLKTATPSTDRKLSGVLLLLKARLLTAEGLQDKALETYNEVINSDNWRSFRAEALIQKALLQKNSGDFDSAKMSLEKAKTLNKTGAFFDDADKYLRLIMYEKSTQDSNESNG